MSRTSYRTLQWFFCGIALAALVFWRVPQRPGKKTSPERRWVSLEGCRWETAQANDGDSFMVSTGSENRVIRLYFVDTCESERYQRVAERLLDQARYFHIAEHQVLSLGKDAKQQVRGWLQKSTFTVHTKFEPVFDSLRVYAHVRLAPDAQHPEGEWLAERLVRLGLARIHTKAEDIPDGPSAREMVARLRQLEAQAREARRGGWALSQKGADD